MYLLKIQLQVLWLLRLSLSTDYHRSHKVNKEVVIKLKMKNWNYPLGLQDCRCTHIGKVSWSEQIPRALVQTTWTYILSLSRAHGRLKLSSSNERKLGMIFKKNPGTIKPQACHWCITAGTPVLLFIVKTAIHLCWPRTKALLHNQHLQDWLKFAHISSQISSGKRFLWSK